MNTTPTVISMIDPVRSDDRWNRPLLWATGIMLALAAISTVLALADPREILGQNAWFKPLKFSLSIAIYTLTLAWLIRQVRRFRRAANIGALVVVAGLIVEMVIIVGAAAVGTTSHFNVTTPLNTTLWVLMAASITIVWLVTLLIGILLLFNPVSDAARNLAIRAGVVLGLIGMATAFFMTAGPTPSQIDDFRGIAGAHAVGVDDGGAGLPFFGWSTEGGDLRVPHFIGMHALQAIPLGLLALEFLSRRARLLRSVTVRFRLVLVGSLAFAASLAILTWQALRGESVIAPSAPTLITTATVAVATVVASTAVLAAGSRAARG